ncbi:MAG: hypothetical protein K0U59_08595, partial [Gammaproteobacteria bacterium]|nr:hypothetical protein [Gammaproteobacteria bacterium]
LGRLTAIVQPGDSLSAPTLSYDYQLAQPVGDGFINWVETRQRESAGGGTINSRHYYDGLGRTLMVKSEAEQSGQVVVSEHNRYNARGQVETSYLPYFAEGLGYKIDQAGPHYRETHYDALGRTKTVYQPPVNGETASFQRITYQPLVQLLEDEEQTRSGSIHAGAAKRLIFDGLQNAEGEPRLRQLDEIVTAGTDSNSSTTRSTRYDYDLNNYFIRLKDAQNNVRNTHYDALGRLRFLSDPNRGQQWQYFDDAGNLLASRDALGQERHYRYDGANRISAEYHLPPRSPAPSNGHWQPDLKLGSAKAVVNYQYDQLETSKEIKAVKANAGFLLGRLAKVTDQTGFEQRSYDARGQLIQRDRKITGPGIDSPVYSSRFSYDSAGRPTKQTYSNGTWVDFHYNARGLLERIPGVVEQLDYNPNGALTHRQMANGIKTDWQFDGRQRLATITSTRATDSLKLQQLDYRFDAVSNVISIRDGRPDNAITTMASELGAANQPISALAQDIVYSYDNLYRLTEVANPREQANYRYDAIGNLLNFSYSDLDNSADNARSIDLRYGGSSNNSNKGASNRLGRTPKDPPGPHAVSWDGNALIYDDNGNQTRAGEHQYHWDHDQRLIETSDTKGTTQYGYDYQHQRRFKITDNKDGSQSITLYIDGDSEVRDGQLHNYVSLGDKRIARSTQKLEGEQSGQADGPFTPSEYYLHNHLGSTALTLGQDAELINAFSYKVYGELENVYGDSTAAPYRFTGKEQDKETGLGYFERRYLNQEYGSFISPDPLLNHSERFTDPQRWSPYRYGRNNPVNYVDPDGRESSFNIRLDDRIERLASGEITGKQYREETVAEGVGAVTGLTLISPVDEAAIGVAVLGKAAGSLAKAVKAAKVTKGAANPVPSKLARVVPGNVNPKTLGKTDDVFVTDASALKGLNSKQIADKLTIPQSSTGFKVIEFPSSNVSGIASPINRTNPGFIQGGRTAGGAPEFVIPNGPIPAGATTRVAP